MGLPGCPSLCNSCGFEFAKGSLQEMDHTPEGWEMVELFMNADNRQYLPKLPEYWV